MAMIGCIVAPGVPGIAACSHSHRLATFPEPWVGGSPAPVRSRFAVWLLRAEMLTTRSRRARCSPLRHPGEPLCHGTPPVSFPLVEAAQRRPDTRGGAAIGHASPLPAVGGMMHGRRSSRTFAPEDRVPAATAPACSPSLARVCSSGRLPRRVSLPGHSRRRDGMGHLYATVALMNNFDMVFEIVLWCMKV
jgi:hypothetical protein